jgi:hypothetical protein
VVDLCISITDTRGFLCRYIIQHNNDMVYLFSYSCPCCVSFTLFRLARGSILASIIHIMRSSPLRVGALYVSGLFVVFHVVCIAQTLWLCERSIAPSHVGYVPFLESPFVFCSRCHELFSRRIPQCTITAQVAILQLTSQSFFLLISSGSTVYKRR